MPVISFESSFYSVMDLCWCFVVVTEILVRLLLSSFFMEFFFVLEVYWKFGIGLMECGNLKTEGVVLINFSN